MKYISHVIIWIVCFDVQLNVVGDTQNDTSNILKDSSTARWKLGTCSSLNSIEVDTGYDYPALYTQRCCLESGMYTLLCYNIQPALGWKDSYLLINGHRYCDDFLTYKSYQTMILPGMFCNESRLVNSHVVLPGK